LATLAACFGLTAFHAEDDPNDQFVFDRTESVLHLSLEAPGGTSLSMGDSAVWVGVLLERYSWQIWRQPSTGIEGYRDPLSEPESGATVTLLRSPEMGSLAPDVAATDDPAAHVARWFVVELLGNLEDDVDRGQRVEERLGDASFGFALPRWLRRDRRFSLQGDRGVAGGFGLFCLVALQGEQQLPGVPRVLLPQRLVLLGEAQEIRLLREKIDLLVRRVFGASSEKLDPEEVRAEPEAWRQIDEQGTLLGPLGNPKALRR
jgi:hypothetical protein